MPGGWPPPEWSYMSSRPSILCTMRNNTSSRTHVTTALYGWLYTIKVKLLCRKAKRKKKLQTKNWGALGKTKPYMRLLKTHLHIIAEKSPINGKGNNSCKLKWNRVNKCIPYLRYSKNDEWEWARNQHYCINRVRFNNILASHMERKLQIKHNTYLKNEHPSIQQVLHWVQQQCNSGRVLSETEAPAHTMGRKEKSRAK